MIVLCAWCEQEGKPSIIRKSSALEHPALDWEVQSHGICEAHRDQVLAKLRLNPSITSCIPERWRIGLRRPRKAHRRRSCRVRSHLREPTVGRTRTPHARALLISHRRQSVRRLQPGRAHRRGRAARDSARRAVTLRVAPRRKCEFTLADSLRVYAGVWVPHPRQRHGYHPHETHDIIPKCFST